MNQSFQRILLLYLEETPDTAHYSGHFDGDYCRNSNYRRKNIAEKKQDSVKAYWQIRSDFVSLPL